MAHTREAWSAQIMGGRGAWSVGAIGAEGGLVSSTAVVGEKNVSLSYTPAEARKHAQALMDAASVAELESTRG